MDLQIYNDLLGIAFILLLATVIDISAFVGITIASKTSHPSQLLLPLHAVASPDASSVVIHGRIIGSSAISPTEISALSKIVESVLIGCQHSVQVVTDDNKDVPSSISPISPIPIPLPPDRLPAGATGRVVVIELHAVPPDNNTTTNKINFSTELIEEWKYLISQCIDDILYSSSDCDESSRAIHQPVLLSVIDCFNSSAKTNDLPLSRQFYQNYMIALVKEQVQEYGLLDPVENHHNTNIDNPAADEFSTIPTSRYEVDGAILTEKDTEGNQSQPVWDTSSILVFDHLLRAPYNGNRDLRQSMLDVVLGRNGNEEENDETSEKKKWNGVRDGPDPNRWISGGLLDLPTQDEKKIANYCDTIVDSFGLSDLALRDIIATDPPPTAFQEFESILTELFSDFYVTRLPEAVLGAEVTPLTANAPCHGQVFDYHIDGDPFFAPPSPWTDIFGRYPNRADGKPRFMSCLLYLNDEWRESWGAPTRFLDVATNTKVDVKPKPGRVVLMDQDITHTVVPPSKAAGKRPRYSLVWKLVLHPKKANQDMRNLVGDRTGWPDTVLVGSAKK